MSYRVHRVTAQDWPVLKVLRLAALADSPTAFQEQYTEAVRWPDGEWQFRAERATWDTNMQVLAATGQGEWVGMMSAFRPEGEAGRALLVGVWVHPDHRGRTTGVADLLLDAVIGWARDEVAVDQLDLKVTETNHRAIAFYLRNGFELTGHNEPYLLDDSLLELGMSRKLAPA
ncbi:MAG: GNAT family N-acetyltransferase [Sporichthyaceae bacterium]|nr:GNAT family N-acetyltransferase [Sporichthyaceae bacterium]